MFFLSVFLISTKTKFASIKFLNNSKPAYENVRLQRGYKFHENLRNQDIFLCGYVVLQMYPWFKFYFPLF